MSIELSLSLGCWFIMLLLAIINFVCAVTLKNALNESFKENKWMVYFFIIPPFAILAWLIGFLITFLTELKKIMVNYFKH
jgi:hypothetical protein